MLEWKCGYHKADDEGVCLGTLNDGSTSNVKKKTLSATIMIKIYFICMEETKQRIHVPGRGGGTGSVQNVYADGCRKEWMRL